MRPCNRKHLTTLGNRLSPSMRWLISALERLMTALTGYGPNRSTAVGG